jgi:hypothetical protein
MRTFIIATTAAAALSALAFAQERGRIGASIPDFSGMWGNPYLYGIEPPVSGPGPVTNRSRRRSTADADGKPWKGAEAPLVSEATKLVGDYTNPILNPAAAAVVKKHAEMSLAGIGYPSPRNQCWPQGVPFVFTNAALIILQQPDMVTLLYEEDHDVRYVRMNAAHPARVTPSWYGDSVGHYEGDTLVVDTVGLRIGPYSAGRPGEQPRRRRRRRLGARPRLQGQGPAADVHGGRSGRLHDRVVGDQDLPPRLPRVAGARLCRKPLSVRHRKGRRRADRGQARFLSARPDRHAANITPATDPTERLRA